MATDSNFHQPSGGVRTYRGRTFGEILPQIRSELGPDAVILREREGLVGGIGGFFAQRFIEVDARPGDSRPIEIQVDEPGDTQAAIARSERPVPSGRRFETAAFIDRLREASAARPPVGGGAAPVTPASRTRAEWTPAAWTPEGWTPAGWPEPAGPPSEPSAPSRPEPATQLKSKAKRKGKGKGAKGKGNGKAKGEANEKSRPQPDVLAHEPMPWPRVAEPAAQTEPAPAGPSSWAQQAEAPPQIDPQDASERQFDGLRRFLPDVLVAALLLILLGPRRYRSKRRASWNAPCPVCGRRGGPPPAGPYGRVGSGGSRSRLLRPRCGEYPCNCR